MSIIFGTTNTDGTGSSSNLNTDNGFVVDGNIYDENGVQVGHMEVGDNFENIVINSNEWNGSTSKEVKLDTTATNITINNFVDADITNTSDVDTQISLMNAKRGQIDTTGGTSSDSIQIGVTANNDLWSNMFEVSTGEGNDTVTMANVENSLWAEFNINTGEGNDEIDVSLLSLSANESQMRHVDGGEGLDTLVTNGDSNLTFEGIEIVVGEGNGAGSALEVDTDLLANNDDMGLGLIISNIDVEMGSDIVAYQAHELSAEQASYLDQEGFDASGFVEVSIFGADGEEYTILTDDADFLA
ncbi:hypothetical protein AB2S62_19440 [Vibrio sp. NTOU-M3]|uniref:hypothetical protein n=1 Tax=Vibrio sp. NTOU-M3 TaxID=3234954 RepID=UPI00349F2018